MVAMKARSNFTEPDSMARKVKPTHLRGRVITHCKRYDHIQNALFAMTLEDIAFRNNLHQFDNYTQVTEIERFIELDQIIYGKDGLIYKVFADMSISRV